MKFFKLTHRRFRQIMIILLIIFTVITSPSSAAPKQNKKSPKTKKPLTKPNTSQKPNTNDHHAKNKIKSKKLISNKTSNKHNTVKKSKPLPKGGKPKTIKVPVIQKFPKLSEFFSKKQFEFKGRTRLTQCEVTTKREPCLYRTTPKKGHCLRFQNIINELTPYYRPFISHSKLAGFSLHEVKDVQINTCSRRVTLITKPQGNFTIYPNSKYSSLLQWNQERI